MDALATLITTLPGSSTLAAALTEHRSQPTRDSWRLVVVLAGSLARQPSLTDAQCCDLSDAVYYLCAAQGWPELADLIGLGDTEIEAESADLIGVLRRVGRTLAR